MSRKPKKHGGERAKFDEAKHRRKAGRFADKPGAGDDAPKHERLKTSGVTAQDRIVDLAGGTKRYAGHETVGSFIDSHPKGRAHAIRVLAVDQQRGVIGFAAPKLTPQEKAQVEDILARFGSGGSINGKELVLLERADAIRTRTPLDAELSKARARLYKWPGDAQVRDVSKDTIRINRRATQGGLFTGPAQVREATAHRTAGVPPQERLSIVWSGNREGTEVKLTATSRGGVFLDRVFTKNVDATWSVEHEYFVLPVEYQGGGGAKRMMRASVEMYDRLNVTRIEVFADIDVGGYSWAKLGFAASDPAKVRRTMEAAAAAAAGDPVAKSVRSVLKASSDDDLMYNLARAKGQDGRDHGKAALLKSEWYGHLDLTSRTHRERLGTNFSV